MEIVEVNKCVSNLVSTLDFLDVDKFGSRWSANSCWNTMLLPARDLIAGFVAASLNGLSATPAFSSSGESSQGLLHFRYRGVFSFPLGQFVAHLCGDLSNELAFIGRWLHCQPFVFLGLFSARRISCSRNLHKTLPITHIE